MCAEACFFPRQYQVLKVRQSDDSVETIAKDACCEEPTALAFGALTEVRRSRNGEL